MDIPTLVHRRIEWGTSREFWQKNFISAVDFSGDNRFQGLYFSH
jgi:hypothetical protein